MHALVGTALLAFAPPPSAVPASRAPSCRMQMPEFPKLPELPKFDLPKLPNPFGGDDSSATTSGGSGGGGGGGGGGFPGFQVFEGKKAVTQLILRPGDVRFTDSDGDVITLKRGSVRTTVDFYVGDELKIEGAKMTRQGNSLQLTGIDRSTFMFKAFGGNFKDEIIDLTTPSDPKSVDEAMKLLG